MSSIIDAEKVNSVFMHCLYRDEEVDGKNIPDGAVLVEGITFKAGFHPQRLESHRAEIREWLTLLPHGFRRSVGGGWSFLNACNQENGEQWTGEHRRVEQLLMLAIGLGLAQYLMPREIWSALPGGMPYIAISVD